ncbi:polysaccharide deacetylase [Klebsiella pneumoniae]|nr:MULTISPECIES: allantoinase PuuE [Klebsiella]MBC4206697.1 allantoinase PuuE [Klebsiella pneumoniae]MBD7493092.1 allantoinase PuuE [Klebsiella pneumoniae]MCC5001636.1 allantoinase PuuE [Klebsiella pneumoniae]MCE7515914.1 allantoinase PuuE [Klebsiella pneumoniae]MCH9571794.1 allantoinase PuuE [Klebsiella pneumoniae]
MSERDLIGYGANPPHPRWPNDSRIAVQFVINYEEGGERSVLYGDRESEAFLTEEPTREFSNIRNLNVESQYEYGSRSGFWRLHRLFTERQLPVTVYGIAQALATHPEAVAAMREAQWEIASHGLRWINYAEMPEQEERRHIARAVKLHTEVTGEAPLGWYTGRMSVNSRRLIVEQGGFLYDSDSFADDLPYWEIVQGHRHLVIPYTLDNNDGRYVNSYGFQAPNFSDYLIQAFDLLYQEGKQQPKMMSIGLHTRISGKPGRAADLARFLDYVCARPGVWVTRRVDIARHWHRHFSGD